MANGDGRAGTGPRELVPRRPRQEVSVTFTPGWSGSAAGAGRPGLAPGSSQRPWAAAPWAPPQRLKGLAACPPSPSPAQLCPSRTLSMSQHPLPWVRSRAGALQGWWGAEVMIPVASTPHPAPDAPKVELRVWRRKLPGGTKGSSRRCEAQGAAPSPRALCSPHAGLWAGAVSSCSGSLRAAHPVQIPGAWVNIYLRTRRAGLSCGNTAGATAAPPARGGGSGCPWGPGVPTVPMAGAAAHHDGRMQFLVARSGRGEGAGLPLLPRAGGSAQS